MSTFTTHRIADHELPAAHAWAVARMHGGEVFCFVKQSASSADLAQAEAAAEREASRC